MKRFGAVFGLELARNLTRPMILIQLVVLALLAWGMSTGTVQLGTGTAFVGGRKAWLTSEFSNAFILSVIAASFYTFFVAYSTGFSTRVDEELKVGELLRSTPLSSQTYAWGKALAYLAVFGVVLALQVALMVFFNHVVPNPEAEMIRGPLELANYLRPALVFALPSIVFFAGTSFYLGVRCRRPTAVFLFPMAVLLALFSFVWNWAPSWLDPKINRALMFADPTGFRWLNETWLKLDRGADFYNLERIELDPLLVGNRLLFAGLGLVAIALAARRLERVRRAPASQKATDARAGKKPTGAVAAATALAIGHRRPLRFAASAALMARAEWSALARDAGIYIFGFFVLTQTLANSLLQLGAFQTPILLTSGQFVMGSYNTLALMLSLVVMFFLVEGLAREETSGIEPIVYSAPPRTAALLAGKILGLAGVVGLLLAASWIGAVVTMLIQGRVSPVPGPFLLVWGLILAPTLLAWSTFLCAVYAFARQRYLTYAVGLGVIAFTLYRQLTGEMTWVGNWLGWGRGAWSDISVLEADRLALVLNRLLVVGLAAFFFAVAVRGFQRRRWDATGLLQSLAPKRLAPRLLALAPYAAAPVAAGVALWVLVLGGHDGEAAQRQAKDYWRQNFGSFRDAPVPAIAAVELDVALEPTKSAFEVAGRYELVNHHPEALGEIVVTGDPGWREPVWRFAAGDDAVEAAEPESRSGLWRFVPESPLPPGGRAAIEFEYSGRLPDGVTESGAELREFILPSSVVLTSFNPSFLPTLGFDDQIGVDEENQFDREVYRPGRHQDTLRPLYGPERPFTTRIRVSVPEELRVNSVGTLESETVAEGRRTATWVSDHPVRLFNIVAGKWEVRRGEGTAIHHHPAHDYNLDEMVRALDGARRHYSEWFYPYPWRELKVSEFPAIAQYAQGFPTNITFSEALGFLTRHDPRIDPVLLVTAHESAHQWWGNLLTPGDGPGGNLLSEAMAHFSSILLIEELAGEEQRRELTKRLEEWYLRRRFRDAERPLVQVDNSRRGDRTLVYDKGAWAVWMLMHEMGREPMLAGLKAFIEERRDGPDYPLLEDMLANLREHAEDPEGFDRFVEQWFFEVVLPEYRVHEAKSEPVGEGWVTTAQVTNAGSGEMAVEVAVVGEGFGEGTEKGAGSSERGSVTIVLAAGETRTATIPTDFRPERLIVDPDVEVLQLARAAAEVKL